LPDLETKNFNRLSRSITSDEYEFLKVEEFKIPIIIIGVIGPVTLINTFCHIHTPFLFSMLRTFNGIWLGLALGLIAVTIFYYTVKIFRENINYEEG